MKQLTSLMCATRRWTRSLAIGASQRPAKEMVFYDLTCRNQMPWSPNTLKVRYALNYKRLPYKTVWLSYPDIAPTLKALGVAPHPAGKNNWAYTAPALLDGEVALQESVDIVDYLEKAYPDTPSVYPFPGSRALSAAVADMLRINCQPHIVKLMYPVIPQWLDDRGAKYFAANRAQLVQKPLDQLVPLEQIPQITDTVLSSLTPIAQLLDKEPGPFLSGHQLTYGDILIASNLAWFEAVNEPLFQRVIALGQLATFFEAFRKYR